MVQIGFDPFVSHLAETARVLLAGVHPLYHSNLLFVLFTR
jgi:hypothetical protein